MPKTRYRNPVYDPNARRLKDLMRWLLTRKPSKWPVKKKITQYKIPSQRVSKGKIRVTFINHATALIQMDDLNILTDPIWSKRCGPFGWAGPKRVSPPGVRFEDLPPIDIVLVSHNHYDHLDLPTLKKLFKTHRPLFCVPKGNKKLLEKSKIRNVLEFDWWEQQPLFKDLKVTYVPGQHFSRRGLTDRNKTLWGGFVLEGSNGAVYFAGDTGFGPHFKDIRKKFGKIKLSLLPIGVYKPRWFMESVHMSPEEAVKAHLELKSELSVAIHFGTFQLSDESIDEPVIDLGIALEELKVDKKQFLVLAPGEGHNI